MDALNQAIVIIIERICGKRFSHAFEMYDPRNTVPLS